MQTRVAQGSRSVTVRTARREDAEAVSAIGRVAFPAAYEGVLPAEGIAAAVDQTYSVEAVAACIEACSHDHRAHFLIAERGGRVVGYLHFDEFGGEPELHRIYVDPDVIGGGVGTALMDELHTRLTAGHSYILMVLRSNDAAIRFYQRHGLTVEREVDGIEFYREHMGVSFPPGITSVPCLVLRYRNEPSAT